MWEQTFGVEIEAAGLDPSDLRRSFLRMGCEPVPTRKACFQDFPNWIFDIKHDGSIGIGSEITTPPMKETELYLLKRVVDMMRSLEMKGTKNCGLHVHVGLERQYDLRDNWIELRDIIYHNWTVLLPKMHRAWPPRENREHYCKMDFTIQQMERDRYVAVNCTRNRHNTVEFRLFNGHLHWRWICRAIRFSCGFMKICKMGKMIELGNKKESVEEVLSRYLDR